MIGGLVLNAMGGVGCLISPLCFLGAIVILYDVQKASSEVKKGKVNVSGNKFSLSNPLTVEIPKELLEEDTTSSQGS
ncbi:TPA: hypothetical protein EYP38_00180 [Candidatus Micrarchaeota archaeon]|nr:hypothetical protein [Candidatus Micrarchaeota archaeon]